MTDFDKNNKRSITITSFQIHNVDVSKFDHFCKSKKADKKLDSRKSYGVNQYFFIQNLGGRVYSYITRSVSDSIYLMLTPLSLVTSCAKAPLKAD